MVHPTVGVVPPLCIGSTTPPLPVGVLHSFGRAIHDGAIPAEVTASMQAITSADSPTSLVRPSTSAGSGCSTAAATSGATPEARPTGDRRPRDRDVHEPGVWGVWRRCVDCRSRCAHRDRSGRCRPARREPGSLGLLRWPRSPELDGRTTVARPRSPWYGGAVCGIRRARTSCVRWSSGGGPAAPRTRYLCGRCDAGCLGRVTIAAGGRGRIPCRREAWPVCACGVRVGSGSAVSPSPAGSAPGCRGGWRPRSPRTGADGRPGPLGDQVDLRTVLAPIDRIRACQLPFFQGPHVHRVNRAAGPVQLAAGAALVQDQAMELRLHPGFRPIR